MSQKLSIESLRFENISLQAESGRSIFNDLNMEIPMGRIVWVRGPASAGKTVFIRMLGGMVKPSQGRYLINGKSVYEMSFEEFLKYRLNIGFSFDFGGLINNRTLYSNLSLPLEYHKFGSPAEIVHQVNRYIEMFGLQDVAQERPSAVAGGFRKAICVARAFMLNPEMLLLDDPTTGLRGTGKDRLRELILENHKHGINKHIFVATEDEAFMRSLKADVLEINNSKVTSLLLEAA